MTIYAELDARSNFSFLEGGSHPAELVKQAKALGLSAIGVADRNSLAGVVRAHAAARELGFGFLVGCRLVFRNGDELIVYPRDRAAYGRLCRLLSIGKSGIEGWTTDADEPRIPKGECWLDFDQAVALGEGMIALVPAPVSLDEAFEARLAALARRPGRTRSIWPDRSCIAATTGRGWRGWRPSPSAPARPWSRPTPSSFITMTAAPCRTC